MTAVSACATITYIFTMMASIFLIQNNEKQDTDDILEFALISSLVYAILQMEGTGSLALDIIFEQFNFELISDQNNDRRR